MTINQAKQALGLSRLPNKAYTSWRNNIKHEIDRLGITSVREAKKNTSWDTLVRFARQTKALKSLESVWNGSAGVKELLDKALEELLQDCLKKEKESKEDPQNDPEDDPEEQDLVQISSDEGSPRMAVHGAGPSTRSSGAGPSGTRSSRTGPPRARSPSTPIRTPRGKNPQMYTARDVTTRIPAEYSNSTYTLPRSVRISFISPRRINKVPDENGYGEDALVWKSETRRVFWTVLNKATFSDVLNMLLKYSESIPRHIVGLTPSGRNLLDANPAAVIGDDDRIFLHSDEDVHVWMLTATSLNPLDLLVIWRRGSREDTPPSEHPYLPVTVLDQAKKEPVETPTRTRKRFVTDVIVATPPKRQKSSKQMSA